MEIYDLLRSKRAEILRLAALHGAHNVRVFGSVARGEAGPGSDVDFLVEMEAERSLMDQGALLQDLVDLLGRDIDLVEPEGLHWYIREKVLQEAVPL